MIRFDDVSKTYLRGTHPALKNLDIEFARGEFVFLVGASGSGKSTLMRLVLKETSPTTGTVYVAGKDLSRIPAWKVPALRREIGMVFQDFRLLPTKTAAQNIEFALQVIGTPRKQVRRLVPEMLELVGLEDKGRRLPHELSGGEQQRVAIARAYVNRPTILLADEPTGNLDPATGEGILELLSEINERGTTVVMATHDQNAVDRMRRRVVELAGGVVIRDDENGTYESDDPASTITVHDQREDNERATPTGARDTGATAAAVAAKSADAATSEDAAEDADATRSADHPTDAAAAEEADATTSADHVNDAAATKAGDASEDAVAATSAADPDGVSGAAARAEDPTRRLSRRRPRRTSRRPAKAAPRGHDDVVTPSEDRRDDDPARSPRDPADLDPDAHAVDAGASELAPHDAGDVDDVPARDDRGTDAPDGVGRASDIPAADIPATDVLDEELVDDSDSAPDLVEEAFEEDPVEEARTDRDVADSLLARKEDR
ncbi:cell division ATP-binding protein FtsE [Brachybacterium sp. AOP25-B2-12]|uniref:cell division ATP-binding protein FtsE n=1 Tax=Brachybacterium sp. AOP25-B2-12 TaxID=3457710 RepID=UPI004033C512